MKSSHMILSILVLQQSIVKTYGITKGNRGIIIKVFATVLLVGTLLIATS